MSYRGQYKLVRKLTVAALGGAAVLAANSGVALAAYGPPLPPSATPVPGGFSCVVTSQTVGPGAKVIGLLRLAGLTASIHVRRETFRSPVQATITEPYGHGRDCEGGQGIGSGGFRGYRAVGAVGILVQQHGSADRQKFAQPLVLRVTSTAIRPSSLIVAWNGSRFVRAPGVVGRSFATVAVTGSSDIAILARVPHPARRGMARPAADAASLTLSRGASQDFLAAARLTSAGSALPGLGVLLPARLAAADASSAALRAPAGERR